MAAGLSVFKARWTAQESEQLAVLVYALDAVENTSNYVVSARSLTTRKNNAYIQSLTGLCLGGFLHRYVWSTISVWKKCLDLFLIADRFCSFSSYAKTWPASG